MLNANSIFLLKRRLLNEARRHSINNYGLNNNIIDDRTYYKSRSYSKNIETSSSLYDYESIQNSRKPLNINTTYTDDGHKTININQKIFDNYSYKPGSKEKWQKEIVKQSPYVAPGRNMKFTLEQYLNAGQETYSVEQLDKPTLKNATNLINKVNQLGELIDYHNVITSGYRSKERQIEIYNQRGEKPALGSKHLSGHALDIYDPEGALKQKILNEEVLTRAKELGLYFENFDSTPNWVHIQDESPAITGRQIWSADDLMERI